MFNEMNNVDKQNKTKQLVIQAEENDNNQFNIVGELTFDSDIFDIDESEYLKELEE